MSNMSAGVAEVEVEVEAGVIGAVVGNNLLIECYDAAGEVGVGGGHSSRIKRDYMAGLLQMHHTENWQMPMHTTEHLQWVTVGHIVDIELAMS